MIVSWIVSATLWTLWMCLAARLVERVLLAGRAPVRGVWILALVLSVGGPLLSLALPRDAVMLAAPRAELGTVGVSRTNPVVLSGGVPRQSPSEARVISSPVRATALTKFRRFERTLSVVGHDVALERVWIVLSVAMFAYIAGGLIRLRLLRRGWRAATVDGRRVLVSEDMGPAVVGLVNGVIVLPEHVLELEPHRRSLMLQHEEEHLRAGDAWLLTIAQLALVLAPWNLLLWWQLRRLRLAVELDCDARVLRVAPDFGEYGRLLLDVGSPRRRLRFGGAAFVGYSTHLERRIRLLPRRTIVSRRTAIGLGVMAGAAAVVLGCGIPAPQRPALPLPVLRHAALQQPAVERPVLQQMKTGKTVVKQPATYRPVVQSLHDAVVLQPTSIAQATTPVATFPGQQVQEPRITVSWDNAPLSNVIKLLADYSHRTILIAPGVTGTTITANVANQTWRVVMKEVLNANGLDFMVNPDSVIVVDRSEAIAVRRLTLAAAALKQSDQQLTALAAALKQRVDRPVQLNIENVPFSDLIHAVAQASGRLVVGGDNIPGTTANVPGTTAASLSSSSWERLLSRMLLDHGYDLTFSPGIVGDPGPKGFDAIIVPDTARNGTRGVRDEVPAVDPGITRVQWTGWSWTDRYEDVLVANRSHTGCSVRAGGDSAVITLLVADSALQRSGRVKLAYQPTQARGLWVQMPLGGPSDPDQLCGVMHGAIRLYGPGVLDESTITVRSATAATFVVKSGSGTVLAGPIRLPTEKRGYFIMGWGPR